jgi:hypothetical protein
MVLSCFTKVCYGLSVLSLTASIAALGSTHTQMSPARIESETLSCEVSETTVDSEREDYTANLVVGGFSLTPVVWNPDGSRQDIKNEPLFVFAPTLGTSAPTADLNIEVFTKMFARPLLTNTLVGEFLIGTPRDVAFEAAIRLSYTGTPSPLSRDIFVNGYKACTLSFSHTSGKWIIVNK